MTIQSVLDVKDDNPSPKSAGAPSLFDRSILILTPARALKFTATSSERHYVWLTALSFLAHSSQAVPESISPQLPRQRSDLKRELAPSYAAQLRKPIRDSSRVAKGKTTSNPSGSASVISSQSRHTGASTQGGDSLLDAETFYARKQASALGEAASPPTVPLFVDRDRNAPHSRRENSSLPSTTHSYGQHHRKRSNTTNGRIPPPLSFRPTAISSERATGTGHTPNSPSTAGVSIAGSSEFWGSERGALSPKMFPHASSQHDRSSARTSEVSSRTGAGNNFFDAVGTVRMEAFISPLGSRHDTFADVEEVDEPVAGWTRAVGAVRGGPAKIGGGAAREREAAHGLDRRGGRSTDDWHGGNRAAGEARLRSGGYDPFHGF